MRAVLSTGSAIAFPPRRAVLRLLVVTAVTQVVGLAVFIGFSGLLFALWPGWIFLFKSLIVGALFPFAACLGLLRLAKRTRLGRWTLEAGIHPLWFSLFSAISNFCIVVTFVVMFPATIDRSVTIFLLAIMDSHPSRPVSTAVLEDRMIANYVHTYGAVQRRMIEETAAGNVVADHGGYRLTSQGTVFMDVVKVIAWIFRTDPRFVDPDEFKAVGTNEKPAPAQE